MDSVETSGRIVGLIDLTDVPLRDLWSDGQDTVIAHSIRRVTEAAEERSAAAVSAFNSAV